MGQWTLLELMPRRMTRPNRVYYHVGHRSLDWFEAAISAPDVLASRWRRRWTRSTSATRHTAAR